MSYEELWAFFFRYGPDATYRGLINEIMEVEEGIAMAGEELLTVTEDERLQAWLMSAEKYDLDLRNDLTEARQEGYEKAESKYQKQLSIKDEQAREAQEQSRQAQEQTQQAQERIRQLEEEIRRLRGE
jgi:peptidoglycan hydrolase CwlO-like protein